MWTEVLLKASSVYNLQSVFLGGSSFSPFLKQQCEEGKTCILPLKLFSKSSSGPKRLNEGVRTGQREAGIHAKPWNPKSGALWPYRVISDNPQWTSRSAVLWKSLSWHSFANTLPRVSRHNCSRWLRVSLAFLSRFPFAGVCRGQRREWWRC